MTSFLPSSLGVARLTPTPTPTPTPRRKISFMALQAKSQSSQGDEGKPSISIVDANLGVLKERIEMVRMEERQERWRRGGGNEGWNYQAGYEYDCKLLKRGGGHLVAESLMEVAELAVGTVGFTILTCSFFLCLISLLVHLG